MAIWANVCHTIHRAMFIKSWGCQEVIVAMWWQPLACQWYGSLVNGAISTVDSHWQEAYQITRFMGPTWGTPGSCRPQMGPMMAPWILLSGLLWAAFISMAAPFASFLPQLPDSSRDTFASCWHNVMMQFKIKHGTTRFMKPFLMVYIKNYISLLMFQIVLMAPTTLYFHIL